MTHPHEILVVDDDRDIRDTLSIILKKNGYRVRLAENGAQALKEIQTRKPDLIILDVMMTTDTEGFDLAFEIRQNPDFGGLPVILLTSFLDKVREDGPESFQHILGEAWPAGWLFEKPVDPDRLLKKLKGMLASGR